MNLAVGVIILLSCTSCVFSARILAIMPFLGKSHHVFHSSVLKVLAKRGHEVVEYSPFPLKEHLPNYTHVEVHTASEEDFKKYTLEDLLSFSSHNYFGLAFLGIWDFLYTICDDTFNDKNIKALLQSNEHFDLVITASTFGQESMLVFGHKFGAPTVTLQGFQYSSFLSREAGNDLSIATIPDSMSFSFAEKMSFTERLRNFISASVIMFLYYNSHLPKQEAILKKYYQSPPPLGDMVTNISLTLVNTHPAVAYAQPYSPNIIPIGGVTVSPERTELPKNIKKFMDEGKDGVIYFSFGTVVPAHTIPMETLQVFINVFKKLPNKVLWKIDMENIKGLSNNVKLVKWVPQPGVLAHPNCAVLVTHGGIFSQQEAMYAGVPIVGIPFFGDQPYNIRHNEYQGIGIKLDRTTLSEMTFNAALRDILNNPKYKENAKQLSRIYRDRPMSPADSAVFWVEYVIRHGGAAHLRPVAAHLAWYQLTLLDVLATVLASVVTVIAILYCIVRRVARVLCGGRKATTSTRKKKN